MRHTRNKRIFYQGLPLKHLNSASSSVMWYSSATLSFESPNLLIYLPPHCCCRPPSAVCSVSTSRDCHQIVLFPSPPPRLLWWWDQATPPVARGMQVILLSCSFLSVGGGVFLLGRVFMSVVLNNLDIVKSSIVCLVYARDQCNWIRIFFCLQGTPVHI